MSAGPVNQLRRGASNAEVRALQRLLNTVGLYTKSLDGHFGPHTEAAVKAFQRAHGLTVDGWAGPRTLATLRQAVAAKAPPAAPDAFASTTVKLVRGARGPEVSALQRQLTGLGFYQGAIGGTFGPATEAAVRAFQRAHHLTVDGWAGSQTLAELRAQGSSPTAPRSPPSSSPAVPPGGATPSARVHAALQFGLSTVGAPYVGGGSPFRFGKPGDGRVYQMAGQRPYRSPAGVVGFDCSGLVVAMFRRAGVDLAAQGLANSARMKASLPAVAKGELQPGDLLVKDGHVVIFLGGGQVLEAASAGDPDGDGLGDGAVRVSDAGPFLRNPSYHGRRVPLP